MSKQKKAAEVLEMAGTTLGKLAIARHERNYTRLEVLLDDDGIIEDAVVTEQIDQANYDQAWKQVYQCGTGSVPCNCDACLAGDKPEDWAAGDGDALQAIEDDIQSTIDKV